MMQCKLKKGDRRGKKKLVKELEHRKAIEGISMSRGHQETFITLENWGEGRCKTFKQGSR